MKVAEWHRTLFRHIAHVSLLLRTFLGGGGGGDDDVHKQRTHIILVCAGVASELEREPLKFHFVCFYSFRRTKRKKKNIFSVDLR